MKLRAMILTPETLAPVKQLVALAIANPIPLSTLFRMASGSEKAPGDSNTWTVIVPDGYRCVFTIEQQTPGLFRHLSVSVEGDGYAPSVEAVEVLMVEFGFTCNLKTADLVWKEPVGKDKVAINVLQQIKSDANQTVRSA